ncbi:MAG: DUF5694 domain-containing protein [Vitreimonas sp.]
MKAIVLAIAAFIAGTASANAQRAFDPRNYQNQYVGQPTQILVIATPHLSGAPDTFDPAVLEPLLARLAAFHPDAIAIEALPGRNISQMWQYRETYPGVAHDYGGRAMVLAAMARQTLSLDMPDAAAQVRQTLQTWPASPTPAQRRRLAALFAASGDPASAIVQWWRLDASERIADDSVSPILVSQFATYETPARRNENYLIAARLAVRLGLEHVDPMDDQSDDIGPDYDGDFTADMQAFTSEPWMTALMADPGFTPLREASNHLATAPEALATYRFLNGAAAGRTDADGQWLNMINRASPHNAGRARVGAWEVRNLRMAANIREIAAAIPGKRVLVIVGSAHKPWLDAYLSMMSDVRVVDARAVLR